MGANRTFTEYEELASAAQRAYEVRRAGEAAEDVVRRLRGRGESGTDVPPFAHLTARTGYSLRDGVIRPRELAAAAAAAGMTHVAMTDRDGLYGAVRFANAAKAEGVVPVFGTDLALEPVDGRLEPHRVQSRQRRPDPECGRLVEVARRDLAREARGVDLDIALQPVGGPHRGDGVGAEPLPEP